MNLENTTNADTTLLDIGNLLSHSPFAQFLECEAFELNNQPALRLKFDEHHIGNPLIRAVHGGVLASFCECTAAVIFALKSDDSRLQKALSQETTYLRSTTDADCYASAVIQKAGRRITTISVKAWQSNIEKPVAISNLRFLVSNVSAK